jgi:hypothetical protein
VHWLGLVPTLALLEICDELRKARKKPIMIMRKETKLIVAYEAIKYPSPSTPNIYNIIENIK